jgi:NitT/TauT family transport system substrate-binding protein
VFSCRNQSAFLHSRLFQALLLCLILVFNSACAPSDSERTKIRLGYIQSDLHHLPAFVAMEKGFFQQQGLDVEVAGAFRAGPELMSAFAAQALDVGYVGLAPAITAAANSNTAIRLIAQVNTEGSAVVVGRARPGNSAADLKGAMIAIPGHATMQDFLLRKALKNAGIPVEQVKILVLKPPEMIPALTAQDIDAFIAWEPYPAKALTENKGKILLYSSQIWQDHPCCVIVAGEEFLQTRHTDAEKLIIAHNQACRFIQERRAEAIDIGVKYTGMDRATIETALGHITYNGLLDRQYMSEYVEFLKVLRYIKQDISDALLAKMLKQ